MRKRILSLLVAVAMVIGMLPLSAVAETTDEAAASMLASYAGEITLDGIADETQWNLYSKMTSADGSATRSFDILWDTGYLYVASEFVSDDTSLNVTVNDVTVNALSSGVSSPAGVTNVWNTVAEVKIPLSVLDITIDDYGVTFTAKLSLGDCSWEGDVEINSNERLQTVSGWSQTFPSTGDYNLKTYIHDDGTLQFTRKYGEGTTTDKWDAAIYKLGASNFPELVDGLEYTSIEFDFRADAMPAYNTLGYLSEAYAARGFSMSVTDGVNNAETSRPDSVNVGITNNDGSLYFLVGHGKTHVVNAKEIGKGLQESFHVQMLIDGEGDLSVYIDGEFLHEFESAVINTYILGSDNNANIPVVRLANYGKPDTDGSASDGSLNVDFSVWNFTIGNTLGESVLDMLTFDTIKGGNESADNVVSDLTLPAVLENSQLGEIPLTWTSDSAVISNTGVVAAATEETFVTLTATVTGTELSKSFPLTVPKLTIDAILADESMTVDGVLSEASWDAVDRRSFSVASGASGDISVLWKGTAAYVAVEYANADTLALTLGDQIWDLSLSETISSGAVTGAAKNGVAELEIDLATAGITLTDYNQSCRIQAVLSDSTNADNAASLEADPITLIFTNQVYRVTESALDVNPTWGASKTGSADSTGLDSNTGYWKHTANNGTCYWVTNKIEAVDHSRDVLTEIDLLISALPEVDSVTAPSGFAAKGVYFWIADCDNKTYDANNKETTHGYYSIANIYNGGSNALYLMARDGTSVSLGKNVGEAFTLGYLWKTDDSAEIYVDNVLVGEFPAQTYYVSGGGEKAVQVRATSPTSGTDTIVSFKDITVTATGYTTVTLEEELSAANVLDGITLTELTNDSTFTLPGTWETMLGTMELTWTASNDGITLTKNADGSYSAAVTQSESKVNTYTYLTMSANGTERWKAETSIVGLLVGVESEVTNLRVPYTDAGITLDGLTTDEGWSLDIGVIKDGASVGSFGAQWTTTDLYMAVDTNGLTTVISLNGVPIDLTSAAKSGDVIEFSVSLETLGVALEDYGEQITASIELDDAKWYGTLTLTSTDWFITDGVEPRLVIPASGRVVLGSGTLDSNQGFEDIGNGYRLFDLYSASGTNPSGVRTYLLCWGTGGTEEDLAFYAPLGDRTEATYTEFDFKALSMPVYSQGNGSNGATDWSSIFSNYGITWNVSAKATNKISDSVSMGIYNSDEGLVFCVLGANGTTHINLNKQVGDQFRLGTAWEIDGSLSVYVDGLQIAVIEDAESEKSAYGDNSFIINLIRNKVAPTCSADNFDIYITNISIGKSRGESVFTALTLEDILGNNIDPYGITYNMNLINSIYDDQLDITANIQWTSSNPDVISTDGTVTRPAEKGELVTLTASWNGQVKEFEVYVKGLNYTSDTMVVFKDLDTANGIATLYDSYYLTLDTEHTSIVLDQNESKAVNYIVLNDGDSSNRLNESCLTIWVSDDNKTYTRVDSFKILNLGSKVYLYDFETTGRYIKVHCTHYLGTEADFRGPQEGMIEVGYEAVFGANGGSFVNSTTVTVTNTTGEKQYDGHWTVSASGIQCSNEDKSDVRFFLNGELLYHYYDGESFVVRIPEIEADGSVTLNVLSGNADATDISNKEYTLEVVYGTRETRVYDKAGRWVVELPDGRTMAVQCGNDGFYDAASETWEARWLTYSFSYNNGLTWTDPVKIDCTEGWLHNPGGITYDPNNGRIIVEGYQYVRFMKNDMASSDCKLRFIYSDDLGATWYQCPDVAFDGEEATYVLSYSDPVIVSSYDGEEGDGIDMVLNNGVQYGDDGSFCCRVAYTRDAGLTWTLGEDKIRFTGGEGVHHMEGGVSEGTILEVKDENGEGTGKLVLYARCQYDSVDVFCIAYSGDYGLNWTTEAELSDIYTVNTQPIFHEFNDAQLLFWGGNNVLGGNSYQRMPMNVAISYDGMESFENIQDLYARYSLQGMTTATRNQIINQSVSNQGDIVTLVWDNNFKESLIMRIDDFTDWFYRTNGIWDSFENSTTKAEGWSTISGNVQTSDLQAKEGNYSMRLPAGSNAVRTIPYLQNGELSFDLYLFEGYNLAMELESAYGLEYGKAAPMGFTFADGIITFLDGTTVSASVNVDSWNAFKFVLDLDAATPVAKLYINGSFVADVPVNTEIGDYVCWFDIAAYGSAYLDCFQVVDNDTVVVPETPEPVEVAEKPVAFKGTSMVLGNSLDAMIWIPKHLLQDATDLVAKITWKGSTYEIPMSSWITSNSTYYRIPFTGIAAKEMLEKFTVQILDGNGNVLSEQKIDSVADYAYRTLNNANDAAAHQMIMDMLSYGAAAQTIFDYNSTKLVSRYRKVDENFAGIGTQTDVTCTDSRTSSGEFYGTSIIMESKIDMMFYFNDITEGMTATVTFTDHYGNEKTKTYSYSDFVYNSNISKYGVRVDNLVVADARQMVTCTVYNGDTVHGMVTDSIESYVARQLASSDPNASLYQTIMNFADSAYSYFHNS